MASKIMRTINTISHVCLLLLIIVRNVPEAELFSEQSYPNVYTNFKHNKYVPKRKVIIMRTKVHTDRKRNIYVPKRSHKVNVNVTVTLPKRSHKTNVDVIITVPQRSHQT